LYVWLRISQPGFADRHEILRGSSATFQTGFFLFWGIAPGMAKS